MRAAEKPKYLLTAKDGKPLVNLFPINNLLKEILAPIYMPDNTHAILGRWKEIIILDLYLAFLQNHIQHKDQKCHGIMARSGQELIRQSPELD